MRALPSCVEWRQAEGSVSFLAQSCGVARRRPGCSNLKQFKAADRCDAQAVALRPLMSEEQLKAFLEKVKSDTSLQEMLEAAADGEIHWVNAGLVTHIIPSELWP